jgi:hypothetical protein
LKSFLKPLPTRNHHRQTTGVRHSFPIPLEVLKKLGPGHIESSRGGVINLDEPRPLRDNGYITSDRGGYDIQKLDDLEEVPRIDEEGKR